MFSNCNRPISLEGIWGKGRAVSSPFLMQLENNTLTKKIDKKILK